MRKDQGLFLAAGVVLGLVVGLVFGYVLFGGGGTGVPAMQSQAPASQGGAPGMAGGAGQAGGPPSFEEMRARLAKNPNDVPALVALGDFLLEQQAVPEAISHYERALAGDPGNAQIMGRVAVGYRTAHQSKKALEMAMKMLDTERNDAQAAALAYDIALHGAGDLDAAARALAEFQRRAPGAPVAGQMQADLDAIRKVIEDGKTRLDDFDAQVKAGNFYYDSGQWALSEAAYRRALAVNPLAAGVITDLGFVVSQQGRGPEALQLFERALSVNPKQWQAALNAVVISLDIKDTASARRWKEALKKIKPDDPNIPHLEERLTQAGG
jgi:tetratricopeptide (TPR) repeat protein